ncbi:MAG: TetR/AcrR family transcriptional regulator [Lentisphaerae bacterium]|nr:TetR/AcrR family transcriptional regulator [Lentisphaerota bacterium]
MPKPINHALRKHRIVSESVKLFAEKGFAQVNFGMLAEACGVSRTLLYTYFKDKREIFNEAIDEVTSRVAEKHAEVVKSRQSADAKIRQICITVFAMLFDNRDFICVVADVLSDYRRKGISAVEKVVRHTVGLKHMIYALLEEAIARGEYDKSVNPASATGLIYSQFEAAALRIAVTGNAELSESIDQMDSILFSFRAAETAARRFR